MDDTIKLRQSIEQLKHDLALAHKSRADAYLQGYNDGISHAAQYVEHHCQDGETHSRAIIRLRPASEQRRGGQRQP